MENEKPIIFLKVNTTGFDTKKDRIIEISLLKKFPDGRIERGIRFFNTDVEISNSAFHHHGIKKQDIEDKPYFLDVSQKIFEFFKQSDVVVYNSKFELGFLVEEFKRCNLLFLLHDRKIIDLKNIYHKIRPHDIYSMLKDFGELSNERKDFYTGQVRAEKLCDMLSVVYDNISKEVESIGGNIYVNQNNHFSVESNINGLRSLSETEHFLDPEQNIELKEGRPCLTFGKYNGVPISSISEKDSDYIEWILKKSDISEYSKSIIQAIIKKSKAQKIEHAE